MGNLMAVLDERPPGWWLLALACVVFMVLILPEFLFLFMAYVGTEIIVISENFVGFIMTGFNILESVTILFLAYFVTSLMWDFGCPAMYRIYHRARRA